MKSSNVNIRINTELKEKFEQLAKSKGMDLSEYLRYLMMKEVEKESEGK